MEVTVERHSITQEEMDNSKGWREVRNRRSSWQDSQHHRSNLSPTRPVERNDASRKGRLEQTRKAINLTAAVQDAASIPVEEREEDIICPNNYQNILIASTRDQEHANKYQAIARIKVQDKFYETNAYETALDMTAKGVIRGIPLEEGPEISRQWLLL
ncbi:hypothetical protein HPB50_009810 [Hyalomma asiaticum]|uniref:Uncharacterized protein n=1 Tax=Hyalomma asiaticum TaxID=266040 RepID=A0ACB7TFQ7_HYAAI|nr:hypothetical protein HPB50_009810 [Hyalomma asiaticum]